MTTAPVAVVAFQLKEGMTIEMGVELKGTTVNVRGRAEGSLPPEKCTSKDPHCVTDEKEIELKRDWTTGGPKVKKTARTRAKMDIVEDPAVVGPAAEEHQAHVLHWERCKEETEGSFGRQMGCYMR